MLPQHMGTWARESVCAFQTVLCRPFAASFAHRAVTVDLRRLLRAPCTAMLGFVIVEPCSLVRIVELCSLVSVVAVPGPGEWSCVPSDLLVMVGA